MKIRKYVSEGLVFIKSNIMAFVKSDLLVLAKFVFLDCANFFMVDRFLIFALPLIPSVLPSTF